MGSLHFSPVKVSKNLICFEAYSSRQVKGISDCKDFMGLEENPVTSIFLWRVQCNFHSLTMGCLHVDYVDWTCDRGLLVTVTSDNIQILLDFF